MLLLACFLAKLWCCCFYMLSGGEAGCNAVHISAEEGSIATSYTTAADVTNQLHGQQSTPCETAQRQ
jgi:hypothetical protein